MSTPSHLLCTVGTSLFRPNLEELRKSQAAGQLNAELVPLAEAYQRQDWNGVARELAQRSSAERLCGAEINSIASLLGKEYVSANCGLFFLHSDTDDGRHIAAILVKYFQEQGHAPVQAVAVADLQDKDPRRFRTRGLRNLARQLCQLIRQYSPAACAINATGGYKAQIALAVLLGQAIGVPVYYKHELFSEIIAFPPLPVALDFEVWMRASGMLFDLERHGDPLPVALYVADWDEKYESLVEREQIDGVEYLVLSPTGQIFHDTFRERFRTSRDQVLPPPVPAAQKKAPILKSNEAHMLAHQDDIRALLVRLTSEVPAVALCVTSYFNPDLPERTRCRLRADSIEGIYSPGSWTVKFRVETSAQTEGQRAAVVAALNEWLAGNT